MHYLSLVSEEDFSNSRVYLKLNSQWSLLHYSIDFSFFFYRRKTPYRRSDGRLYTGSFYWDPSICGRVVNGDGVDMYKMLQVPPKGKFGYYLVFFVNT